MLKVAELVSGRRIVHPRSKSKASAPITAEVVGKGVIGRE